MSAASVFSPAEAAFAGFRLMRSRPRALAVWTALQMAFIAVSYAINSLVFASNAQQFREIVAINQVDPAQALGELVRLLPVLTPLLLIDALIFLVCSGVQNAAIFRAYLEPGQSRHGYLRLGRAELSLALVLIAFSLLGLAYLFAVLFVFDLSLILGGSIRGGPGALFHLGLAAVLMAAVVYPAVRLSLALPMTFAARRVRIFDSWRLTRGRFWPLFGAYVLSLVYVVLTGLAALVLFAVLAWGISRALGGTGADAWRPGEAPIAAQALTLLINLPLQALLLTAGFTLWRGPSAMAYLALSGAREEPAA
jgi:hypothetical protein